MIIRFLYLLFFVLVCQISACAYEQVKPWQRDLLAEDQAQLVADPLEAAADEHIYFSKEAASGGSGVGGGGCGCN